MSAALELQKTIYNKLKEHDFRVFDFPPEKNTPYPFVIIGDDMQLGNDLKNGEHIQIKTTITTYTDYKGKMEIEKLNNSIMKILETINNLESYKVVSIQNTSSFSFFDKENEVMIGIIETNFKLIKTDYNKQEKEIRNIKTEITQQFANYINFNLAETEEKGGE